MHDTDLLAQRFEEHRARLTAVAYRMLGSTSEANDAVQETWLRLSRSDPEAIENLGGWLTTVLARAGAADRARHPLPRRAQLASRARRRLPEKDGSGETDRLRQARLVDAYLAAARNGEFQQLLALLDPDVVLSADPAAVEIGVAPVSNGAAAVAKFSRHARGATPALLDGEAAVVWLVDGRPRVVYKFTVGAGGIATIELIAEPGRLRQLDLTIPGG